MAHLTVISAPKNGGKSTAALKIKEKHPDALGFVSLKGHDGDEITLLDLENSNRLPLMSAYFRTDNAIGRYHYLESTFRYCSNKAFPDGSVVVLDEVGRLEISGKGFDSLLKRLIKTDIDLYITVRDAFVPDVLARYACGVESLSVLEVERN